MAPLESGAAASYVRFARVIRRRGLALAAFGRRRLLDLECALVAIDRLWSRAGSLVGQAVARITQ
jgi:hypothetical protein